MKKHYLFNILFILLFGISALIAYLEAAEIIYVEGAVQVLPVQEKAWKEVRKGMKLNLGDSIRTARHSKIDIALGEEKNNVIRIEQKTLVVLNASSPDFIDKIDLSKGKIYINLENLRAGLIFEVSTPSAVAGVRGTGWSLYTDKDGDEVAVYENEVFIKTFDAQKKLISELILPEGFKAFVERFEAPSELVRLSEREMQNWYEFRHDIFQRIKKVAKPEKEIGSSIENITEHIDEQKETIEDMSKVKEQIEEKKSDETRQEEHPGHYY